MNKWRSAGGVVLPHTGEIDKVYIVAPAGGFGGYDWVFPKGRIDSGETDRVAALREVKEEAGLDCEVLSSSPIITAEGSLSVTSYYMMRAHSEPGQHDEETELVKLCSFDEARDLLHDSARDMSVLDAAITWIKENLEGAIVSESNEKRENVILEDLGMSLVGKVFFGSIAAWLVGRALGIKIRGTPRQVNAVKDAMLSSRKFRDELQRPGASIDTVINKLNLKNASAQEFERVLGVKWPL
ncbi:MAG: NUDIX domain-containing protein [Candidatus Neomarinimicrobiota bacterium]